MHSCVENIQNAFGTVHTSCRGNFVSKTFRSKLIAKYGKISQQCSSNEGEDVYDVSNVDPPIDSPVKERLRSSIVSASHLCFICNEETENDHLVYAEGGINRCARDTAGRRLERHKQMYLNDKTHIYHDASRRLDLLLKGNANDIWAADVYTHKAC